MNRDFSASGPDQLWVADITYVPTWAGWLYLAVVLDVWSRRVVGWAMATHMRTELVEAALAMAITRRRPEGRVVHHSDQGSQPRFKRSSQQYRVEGFLAPPVLLDTRLPRATESRVYSAADSWTTIRGPRVRHWVSRHAEEQKGAGSFGEAGLPKAVEHSTRG